MLKKVTLPLIIILAILIFLIPKSLSIFKINDLEKNLSDIDIEKLTLKNHDYQIKEGKVFKNNLKLNSFLNTGETKNVLALASFYTQEQESPILALNANGVEDFKKSTSLLAEVQKKFVDEKLLDQEIYPISFLTSIGEVAKVKQVFEENISDSNASKVIDAYRNTNQLYLQNVNNLKNYYSLASKSQNNPKYVALDTATSATIIKNDLEKIKKNSDALKKEIDNRQICLENSQCTARELSQNLIIPKYVNSNLPTTLETSDLVTAQYQNSQKYGPYLIKTPCFGDIENKTTYPFYAFFSKNGLEINEYKTILIKRADEVFFRKLNTLDPLDRAQIKKGVNWNWFGESNQYACNNLTYQTKIATIAYFKDNFKEPILGSIKEEDEKLKDLSAFEKDFFASVAISEENFDNLAKVYEYTYQILKNKNVTSSQMPIKTAILNRYQAISMQLGYFERLLNQTTYTLETNLIRDKKLLDEKTVNHDYFLDAFLSSRIQYSLLYFPFTKSFWQSTEVLNYLENEKVKTVDNNQAYMTLTKAKETYSEKEIKSWYVSVLEQIASSNKPSN